MKLIKLTGFVVGTIALVAFGYLTSLWAAIALFFVLWANNMSQVRSG